VRYYTLSAASRASEENRAYAGGVIGITSLSIPKYLDRPQIVMTGKGNRLILNEFDRWAEPLADGAGRVLAAHIAEMAPAHRVLYRGWFDKAQVDYAVNVEVQQFEGARGGEVVLAAAWSIQRRDAAAPDKVMQNVLRVRTDDDSIDALTHAMGEALAKLAQAIAAQITSGQPS
jgi:uncharacterized lipoprotein YmbA